MLYLVNLICWNIRYLFSHIFSLTKKLNWEYTAFRLYPFQIQRWRFPAAKFKKYIITVKKCTVVLENSIDNCVKWLSYLFISQVYVRKQSMTSFSSIGKFTNASYFEYKPIKLKPGWELETTYNNSVNLGGI